VAKLMQLQEPLTVDDFTKVLAMMKKSHERYFFERQVQTERSLDRLADFLAEEPDEL